MMYFLFVASLALAQECPNKIVSNKKICLTEAEIAKMEADAVVDANRIASEKAKQTSAKSRRDRIKSGCTSATGLLKDLCEEMAGQ
jgi:hypothetical protein